MNRMHFLGSLQSGAMQKNASFRSVRVRARQGMLRFNNELIKIQYVVLCRRLGGAGFRCKAS